MGSLADLRRRLSRIETALRELHEDADDLADLVLLALHGSRRLRPREYPSLPYRRLPRTRTWSNA